MLSQSLSGLNEPRWLVCMSLQAPGTCFGHSCLCAFRGDPAYWEKQRDGSRYNSYSVVSQLSQKIDGE